MRARLLAALLLAALFALSVSSVSPAGQIKDPPKDPLKDIKDKEKDPKGKDKDKGPHGKWPTNIGGKGVQDWLKDATEHKDPAVREFALKTLPGFGPDIRKTCSARLIQRMARETDPGVRITVFNTAAVVGLDDSDIPKAVLILARAVDEGSGLSRLHAVNTLGLLGPKAEGAVTALTGVASNDPAYETRRSIAATLASVGFDPVRGPNLKALNRLGGTLAKDESAAVRMEALQSLVILGPPWADKKQPGSKVNPPVDWKNCTYVADSMRSRVGHGKVAGAETDKQLEIWCRVVLMRFDQKEGDNPEHMDAFAKYISEHDLGPKLQALQALALFGERGAPKIDAVVQVLRADEDNIKTVEEMEPVLFSTALNTLAAMGVKAKGAIPALSKVEKRLERMREARKKDPDLQKLLGNLKPEEVKLIYANLQEEQLRLAVANTIAFIEKSKPGLPGGDPPVEKKDEKKE